MNPKTPGEAFPGEERVKRNEDHETDSFPGQSGSRSCSRSSRNDGDRRSALGTLIAEQEPRAPKARGFFVSEKAALQKEAAFLLEN
jgi:hypothetical protein